jgi:hypothetical protein
MTLTTRQAKAFAVAALLVGIGAGAGVGCASRDGRTASQSASEEPLKPPQIYANMPLKEALGAAVDFGGDTLESVKRLVKRRSEGAKVGPLMEEDLAAGLDTYEPHQLLNAGNLYATFSPTMSPELLSKLVRHERPVTRQLGWQLAAIKPSATIAAAVDRELTRAIADGEEGAVLIPQMANAVLANKLKSSYTLVRQGLMANGDEEYAHAMIGLEPARAADDFLPYLAQAPAEELRQLTLASVNLYTCLAILKHLAAYPPSAGNPALEHLFLYAVSRNTALAEMAQNVIETLVPERTDLMAQLLARHPAWVQIAYVEGARRRAGAKTGLLMAELKKATTEQDVAAEIDQIKF